MAKTKAQKEEAVKGGIDKLKSSETVILADFTGLSVNDVNKFRRTLEAAGATFKVLKKRLLKFVFEASGITFDPKEFHGQTGVIFSTKDSLETSALAYKFSKAKETKDMFKILGGFSVKDKQFIAATDIQKLGQLPSREVLLGQLVYVLSSPIKKLLFVLDQKAKKTG